MPRKNVNRAAVSNGTRLLPGSVDGRGRFARRYRDLVQDISADLGGADRLSTLQHQLIRRAAALASQCELIEADIAAGRPADLERFSSAIALLTRVSRQIGLQRLARDIDGTPTLQAYLAARERERDQNLVLDHEPAETADADAHAQPLASTGIDATDDCPADPPAAPAASPEPHTADAPAPSIAPIDPADERPATRRARRGTTGPELKQMTVAEAMSRAAAKRPAGGRGEAASGMNDARPDTPLQ